ncbi:MAG: DMT family transporter [Magnetospiraceae bacterium]
MTPPSPNQDPRAKGLMFALAGVLILSPDALLIKLVSVDLWTLLVWRGGLTALVLAAVIVGRRGWSSLIASLTTQLRTSALGLLYTVSTLGFVASITLTSAANTLLVLAAMPLISALMERFILGTRIARRTQIAIVFALCGMAIMASGSLGESRFWGDLLAISCAFPLALYFTLIQKQAVEDTVPLIMVGGLGTFIVALGITLWGGASLSVPGQDLIYLALLGMVILPTSFVLLSSAARWVSPAEVTLIMLLEALFGPLWVWMGIGEVPPQATFFGGGVILVTLLAYTTISLQQARTARP